jgi:hypothetical protein
MKKTKTPPDVKQSKRGGRRAGAGAPRGNRNAVTHGIYAQMNVGQCNDNSSTRSMLITDLAIARARLSRALQFDKYLQGLAPDSQERLFTVSHRKWVSEDGRKCEHIIKRSVDVDAIIHRVIGTILNLECAIFKLKWGCALRKQEQMAVRKCIYRQIEAGHISQQEAKQEMVRYNIPIPDVLPSRHPEPVFVRRIVNPAKPKNPAYPVCIRSRRLSNFEPSEISPRTSVDQR